MIARPLKTVAAIALAMLCGCVSPKEQARYNRAEILCSEHGGLRYFMPPFSHHRRIKCNDRTVLAYG